MDPDNQSLSPYAKFLEYPVTTAFAEGEVRYLNPKQIYRILKRKMKRN
jgi:hypothetical protein